MEHGRWVVSFDTEEICSPSQRCSQAQISRGCLHELEWIGWSLTANMETSMVRKSSSKVKGYRRPNISKDGQMHEAVAALAASGVSPVVRIPANEAWMVKSMHTS